jgi:EthD domain
VSKNIALLPRRCDLTRAQFHEYYETRHAPLAIGYFPFTRYVRNHLVDGDGLGFDTVSEFWSDDVAGLSALMQTEVGELMRADEQRFMDRPRIRSAGAEEHLLAGAPRTLESAALTKHAWLLRRAAGAQEPAFLAALIAWARSVAATGGGAGARVTLDLIRPWPGAEFPFDAVLWFWVSGHAEPSAGPVPAGVTVWARVHVLAEETPPQVMAEARRQRASSNADCATRDLGS